MMYEVELRALVDNFEGIKKKLEDLGDKIFENQREVTIFFFNPNKDDFDLRLKLTKDKNIISFKEGISKKARKEIESEVSNPKAIYDLLLESGFKIKMIVGRVKHVYQYKNFNILLNKVLNWGDAVEVETEIKSEEEAEEAEKEIKDFIQKKLGLKNLLSKERMLEMNEEYNNKYDFNSINLDLLIDYVNGKIRLNFDNLE